jgi:hypothetical protein
MEGRSYGYMGPPKLVARQLEALKADLLGRVAALEASKR